MSGGAWRLCARGANWWIRRNPTYLISAAAMALGARWYLVTPDAPAGEIGLILLTLGCLQAYELAVSSVLIALHRRRKSPEDQPSLLLVAALFWTGPMAATVEMTARDDVAGVGFGAAACLLALIELQTVRRAIGLRLSPWCQAAASACVVLLAAAPVWLRVTPSTAGTDEVALYLSWWVLGGVMLLALGGLAWHGAERRRHAAGERPYLKDQAELAFLGVVFVASAVNLWGMNYAFFGAARLFYAAPILIASAVLLFDYFARMKWRAPLLWGLAAAPPGVAIALAFQGFHEDVPVSRIPAVLRDPLLAALVGAAAAWWFGCARSKSSALLHLGALALMAAVVRGVSLPVQWTVGGDALRALAPASRDETVVLVYGLAVYLAAIAWLRRSRTEIVAALAVHWIAVALLVWRRTPADAMTICLVGGWSWLAVLHIVLRRPSWRVTVWPVAALTITTGLFTLRPDVAFYAGLHAAGMTGFLLVLGWLWSWTRYRIVGSIVGGAFLSAAIARGVAAGAHPKAAAAVLCAFLLLVAGAALSWNKQKLLKPVDACDKKTKN